MQLKPILEPKHYINQTEYYYYREGFSTQELEWIENLKDLYHFEPPTIDGSSKEIKRIRLINPDEKSEWLYDKLTKFALDANRTVWDFDLHSIIDDIQYTEYLDGGFYDWHLDIGPDSLNHRKISIITQLSDSNEYEGGDLEFWTNGKFISVPKIKGYTILFPSFLLNRVTPVTKGVKKILVLWISGCSYK